MLKLYNYTRNETKKKKRWITEIKSKKKIEGCVRFSDGEEEESKG